MRGIGLILLASCSFAADGGKPVFPHADWERIAKSETAGYSSAKLDVLRAWLKTQNTTAMMVTVDGRVLFEYGDIKHVSVIASARKSVLGMLYGKYVIDGTIDLKKTVKQIGLDDHQKFLPIEEGAVLEHLLMSRSGIYHPDDGGVAPPLESCGVRGSQYPGTFFCYYNWDFNAAGTAFEKLSGKNIYDALETDLARPIAMQDFDRAKQKKDSAEPHSVHPVYHMYLSTRDMARLGLLMLREGNWDGKQLIDPNWVRYLTTLVTPVGSLFPQSSRTEAEMTGWRWGFGVMWWVWDSPKLPRFMSYGDWYGAYCAMGYGGQYLTVLPARGLVIAHKVEIKDVPPEKFVYNGDYMTILRMLLSARCEDGCK